MNVYTVHYRQEVANSLAGLSEDAVLVKDGFSWPALLFPLIWFLMNRMWIPAVIYLAFEVVLLTVAAWIEVPGQIVLICTIAVNLILGFEGHALLRWNLARRRFHERAIVTARNLADAEYKFFSDAVRELRA